MEQRIVEVRKASSREQPPGVFGPTRSRAATLAWRATAGGQPLLFDKDPQKGRRTPQILAPEVTWRRPGKRRAALGNGGRSQDARIVEVRHRSRATYSRQPRQVRKEATVTGSCVCSESPVPGLFSFHTRCSSVPPITKIDPLFTTLCARNASSRIK